MSFLDTFTPDALPRGEARHVALLALPA